MVSCHGGGGMGESGEVLGTLKLALNCLFVTQFGVIWQSVRQKAGWALVLSNQLG